MIEPYLLGRAILCGQLTNQIQILISNKMGLGNIIIGAVLMATFVVPFVLAGRSNKKGKNQMLLSLRTIANQHNSSISIHEFCGDFVIGMDELKNFVFFYKKSEGKELTNYIDLSEMKSCHVHILRRESLKGADKLIDKLDLSFTPHDRTKKVINLEFYNTEVSSVLTGELQAIEKWSKLISDRLTQQNKLNRAS